MDLLFVVCIPRISLASQKLHSRPGPVNWISGSGRFVKNQLSAISRQRSAKATAKSFIQQRRSVLRLYQNLTASRTGSAFVLPFVRTSYDLCRQRLVKAALQP